MTVNSGQWVDPALVLPGEIANFDAMCWFKRALFDTAVFQVLRKNGSQGVWFLRTFVFWVLPPRAFKVLLHAQSATSITWPCARYNMVQHQAVNICQHQNLPTSSHLPHVS